MTQIEARRAAKELKDKNIPVVAGTVPLSAWGGHERTWGIYLMVSGRLELLES